MTNSAGDKLNRAPGGSASGGGNAPSNHPGETPRRGPVEQDLAGYEVIVCVCGGIAAYKACELVSRLAQRGAGVTTAMTRSARKFVGKATLQALSGRSVLTSIWHATEPNDVQHIGLTSQADLLIVAPATANSIARFAGGFADDIVSTLYVSADSPILLAPAMNDRMWASPIVQRNVAALKEAGAQTIGPESGWLACRSVGPGRMSEPADILQRAAELLLANPPKQQSAT